MKRLKLFFALWPEEPARRELGRWAGSLHRLCTGRRMATENLHITLAFLGQVEAGQFDAIVAAARGVQARQFMLRLDEPGYRTRNHIAWLGASKPPEELAAIAAELRAALVAAAISFDPKPFVPHVTMVRNARPPREEWPTLNPVQWQGNGFSLISSERDESGPYYRIVAGPFAVS